MYGKGLGVRRNFAEAESWYRKAAEQGNAMAQANLGLMYFNRQSTGQDAAEAESWLRKSAEQGVLPAKTTLEILSQP
jgi:TPR repeat protein